MLFSATVSRAEHTMLPERWCTSDRTRGEIADLVGDGIDVWQPAAYGDGSRPELAGVDRQTVGRGGSMVVHAFAVESTQKLCFMMRTAGVWADPSTRFTATADGRSRRLNLKLHEVRGRIHDRPAR